MSESSTNAPAGWYPDSTPGYLRWWDGTAWTQHTAPVPAQSAAPDAAAQRRVEQKYARQIAKANRVYNKQHATWAARRDQAAAALNNVRTFQPAGGQYFAAPAQLIEQRAGQVSYHGASRGVSIPVASIGGHAIRYHVGASKGHVTRGAPEDKVIDAGRVVVTAKGVDFVGTNQTRACDFKKMIDMTMFGNELHISVSNRQKPTRIRMMTSQFNLLASRIALAQADAAGSRDPLITQLAAELDRIVAEEPRIAG